MADSSNIPHVYEGVATGMPGRTDVENPGGSMVQEHPAPNYNKCTYLYYRYLNPWYRALIVAVIVVYFYAVLLNITTWRNAEMSEETLNMNVPSLRVERPDNRGYFLVLKDLLYDVIPRAPFNSPEMMPWKHYVDICAFLFNLLVLVICLLRRDILRFAELFGLHITLYVIMYFTKIITLYPAPSFTEGCMKPEHRVLGSWIFKEVATTDFCGDQMFSGHTNNTFLPLIILTRILYDIVGWDLRICGNHDDYFAPEYAVHQTVETTPAVHPTFTDNNEDFWFHPRYSFSEPPKWRINCIVWFFVMFWRILKWVILAFFVYGLLRIRQHYTADIFVSMMVQIILSTNTRYVQSMVRWMYRPNYWNYKRTGMWLVKLRQPWTREQANYEDRVAKLGRGGIW